MLPEPFLVWQGGKRVNTKTACQSVYRQTVRIHKHGLTADGGKIESVFPSNNAHEIVRLDHLKTSCDYYFHAHIKKM